MAPNTPEQVDKALTGIFSPKVKFIAITVDELILVPIAIIIVYYFAPQYLWATVILTIIGAAIFVAVKYYLVYPSLLESGSFKLYDLKGMTGVVTDTVTPKSGKIRVGAEIWDARCEIGEIPPGADVRIISRQDLRVLVAPVENGDA